MALTHHGQGFQGQVIGTVLVQMVVVLFKVDHKVIHVDSIVGVPDAGPGSSGGQGVMNSSMAGGGCAGEGEHKAKGYALLRLCIAHEGCWDLFENHHQSI